MNRFIEEICNRIFQETDVKLLKDKTILITGANGLIGGFLADFFHYLNTQHNFNIKILLTSLSDKPKRIEHLIKKDNIEYYSQDLSIGLSVKHKVDYCFYCAGYAQPSKFLSDTTTTFFLNTSGVQKTFSDIYKNNKNARCVFLSSSEIYALNETETSHKETDLINVSLEHKRNSYIFGKIGGEMIVNDFVTSGFDAVSARVSLCYGPGHLYNDARVMSDITRKAMSEASNIKLFDDGSALRRYLHISDFIIMLLNVSLYGTNSVYNIGGKEEVSIFEMANHIGKFFNKTIEKGIPNNKVSLSAPKRVWVSLERYKKEFGETNFLSFANGIDTYLKWFVNEFKGLQNEK